jgi:hypothetical protein
MKKMKIKFNIKVISIRNIEKNKGLKIFSKWKEKLDMAKNLIKLALSWRTG